MGESDFEKGFYDLTGHEPMGWQGRLFHELAALHWPDAVDIPTGLGKTSIMVIWLLALASQARRGDVGLPRRLVYVVNRRTVVDQATDMAMMMREKLREAKEGPAQEIRGILNGLCLAPGDEASPLAISTLRGELADNREWQADPSRPAIIIGTVDMIGSRLLFSGYGASSSYRRAQAAGLIGHDSLIVHDEAHLSPAFSRLIKHIASVQEQNDGGRALRILELSATQRVNGCVKVFGLEGDEWRDERVSARVMARKALRIHPLRDASQLAEQLAAKAWEHHDKKARVLIYVYTPDLAKDVRERLGSRLKKEGIESVGRVGVLTGTLRGYERDRLVKGEDGDPAGRIFRHFRASPEREAPPGTLFLISTSAGEVGVDLDADHLVCDLTTLDSMIQRLGRVNRLGRDHEDFVAQIDVFDAPDKKGTSEPMAAAREQTREALQNLTLLPDGNFDASPKALRELLHKLSPEQLEKAFAPQPQIVPCTDILLDAWALTSVRGMLPGRPPVEKWLHGVSNEDQPETAVIWRDEATDLAQRLAKAPADASDIEEWFDVHPVLVRERLRDATSRVAKEIKRIAVRWPEHRAIVISGAGAYQSFKLSDLADGAQLAHATLILPSEAGGLSEDGTLTAREDGKVKDVADIEPDPARARMRLLFKRAEDETWTVTRLGEESVPQPAETDESFEAVLKKHLDDLNGSRDTRMHLVVKGKPVVLAKDEEGRTSRALVSLGLARNAETAFDNQAGAPKAQSLDDHLKWTEIAARHLSFKLGLAPDLGEALACAARWHDRGKKRVAWQKAIYNAPPEPPLAKTDHGRWRQGICDGYRHELGSLIEAADTQDIRDLTEEQRELVLHLIAAHHGWARPHFEPEAEDLEASPDANAAAMAEAMRRYARLQRRYGRWGLAWLEALLKAADAIASTHGAAVEELTA